MAEELAHVDDIDAVLQAHGRERMPQAVRSAIRKVLICVCPKGLSAC